MANDEVESLRKKIITLEKINKALIKRVKSSTASHGNAFSLFEGNIRLQKEVLEKTKKLGVAEKKVFKQKRALDAVVLISESDINGIIKFVNERYCKTSGYSAEELIGQDYLIFESGKHSKDFWKSLWKTISSGETFRGEICNKAKDGSLFWLESVIFPNRNDEDQIIGYTSVSIDITEKKLKEEQFMHQSRLASIGEMAAGVGHEVNNPLAVIYGNITFIMKYFQKIDFKDSKVNSMLEKIFISAERIKKIVDGLRAYTRTDKDESNVTNVADVITSTLDLVKEIYSKDGVTLNVSIESYELYVFGSSHKLQQVIMNLLSNAKDATEGKSNRKISISLKKISEEKCLISVSDNGVGIEEELINKILEPFFTTKPVGKGTGLGLGIVNEIIKGMQGQLVIDSTLHEGSEFKVQLPLIEKFLDEDIET